MTRISGISIAVAALATAIAFGFLARHSSREPEVTGMVVFDPPKPVPAFRLRDQHDRVFDLERLRGRWSFLFFGYTHCPDICPTTLMVLRDAQRIAGGKDQGVQYVLVSVDPARDSAEVLRQYATYFHSEFIGATGDDAELRRLAQALGAYYERGPVQDGGPATASGVALPLPSAESYDVAHSAAIFLIDPEARLRALFAGPHDAARLANGLKRLRGD